MGKSPASNSIRRLNDWQKTLIYETAMSYPVEGLRKSYFDAKKSTANIDDDILLDPDMGYTQEEIDAIKGKR